LSVKSPVLSEKLRMRMKMPYRLKLARAASFGVAGAFVALCLPSAARAQAGDMVYASSDLEVPPKIAAPTVASRIVQGAYPDALRRTGVGGIVQLQFVVGPSGKVEPSSIEVLESPVDALAEAAKRAVTRMEFKPGMHNGQAVRARVLLPVVFKSNR
jgi:protein TonB